MLSFFGFVAVADERVGTRPSTVAQNGRGRLTVLLHTTVLIVLNSSVYPHRRPVHPVPALILRPREKHSNNKLMYVPGMMRVLRGEDGVG